MTGLGSGPSVGLGPSPGVGIGWRAELARFIAGMDDLRFVEVIAEGLTATGPLPGPLAQLRARGVRVVPHGVRLSLGGADKPDRRRIAHLARVAELLDAPLVSEHVAFVRAGGTEAGHLMPVPRTREALQIVAENVRQAQEQLPVPLALEQIAALVDWPEAEMDEAAFLCELLDRTGALLLLDVANLYANARNHRYDPLSFLDRLPLDRIAYVHVAGAWSAMASITTRTPAPSPRRAATTRRTLRTDGPAGVLLERDDDFPPDSEIAAFARVTPPPEGGALADGLAFSQVIARERRLPDDARIESMLATSRVKLRHNRLVARRGPRLAAAMTGRPRRLVVIATLPPIGTRIATLGPLTRARRSQPGTRPR